MGFFKTAVIFSVGLAFAQSALAISAPDARADDGAAPKPAPSSTLPKFDGLTCPFQMSADQQSLQNQLTSLLKEISDESGKAADCADVKSRIQDLSTQLQQQQLTDAETAQASTTTTTGGVAVTTTTNDDPAAKMNQELLAENMTFALGSHCTAAFTDPTPLIYTSLFLASSFNTSVQATAGLDAAAVLLVELGQHIAKWLNKPSPAAVEATDDDKEQNFTNRLCMLYLYNHEVDKAIVARKAAEVKQQAETKKAEARLHQLDLQLATPTQCNDCDDSDSGSLKDQLKGLQSTLHQISGDSALVDACGDIRNLFDRNSNSYKTIDGLGASCSYTDPASCVVKDDGKVSLTQADFCGSWCSLKSTDLALNFNCDDASPSGKQELRSMENRARTVLQYVLAEGGAARLDKSALVQYQDLVAEKQKLETQLDAAKETRSDVQDHESEPRLHDKVDALTGQILGSDITAYVKQLSQRNKKQLSQVKDEIKKAKKGLRDPAKASVDTCPLVQDAAAGLKTIGERLEHYDDLCTYLGNKAPALQFTDSSLSFWDQSSYLRDFCTSLPTREQNELSSQEKQDAFTNIAAIQKQASCTTK